MFWFDNPRCRKSTTFDVLHAFVQPQEVLKGSRKSIPGTFDGAPTWPWVSKETTISTGSQIEEGVGQAWSGITEFELEGTVMFDLWMLFRQEGGDPGRFPKRCQGWGRCARSRKLILCCSPRSGPGDWINLTSNRKNVCIMLVCVFFEDLSARSQGSKDCSFKENPRQLAGFNATEQQCRFVRFFLLGLLGSMFSPFFCVPMRWDVNGRVADCQYCFAHLGGGEGMAISMFAWFEGQQTSIKIVRGRRMEHTNMSSPNRAVLFVVSMCQHFSVSQ